MSGTPFVKSERRTSSTPIAMKNRKKGLSSWIAHRVDRRVPIFGAGRSLARIRLAVLEPHGIDRRNGALRDLRAVHLRPAEGAAHGGRVGEGIEHVDVERALEHAEIARQPDRQPAVFLLDPLAHVVREVRSDQRLFEPRLSGWLPKFTSVASTSRAALALGELHDRDVRVDDPSLGRRRERRVAREHLPVGDAEAVVLGIGPDARAHRCAPSCSRCAPPARFAAASSMQSATVAFTKSR